MRLGDVHAYMFRCVIAYGESKEALRHFPRLQKYWIHVQFVCLHMSPILLESREVPLGQEKRFF